MGELGQRSAGNVAGARYAPPARARGVIESMPGDLVQTSRLLAFLGLSPASRRPLRHITTLGRSSLRCCWSSFERQGALKLENNRYESCRNSKFEIGRAHV